MLNKNYLSDETVTRIREHFEGEGSISLRDFIDPDALLHILSEVHKLDMKHSNDPMHSQYSYAKLPKLNIDELCLFFSKILGVEVKAEGLLYSFGHREYTLLHDDRKHDAPFECVIDLTPMWEVGFGGNVHYIDGTGNFVMSPPVYNSCFLIKKEGLQRFVKYVNHKAGDTQRLFLLLEIKEK